MEGEQTSMEPIKYPDYTRDDNATRYDDETVSKLYVNNLITNCPCAREITRRSHLGAPDSSTINNMYRIVKNMERDSVCFDGESGGGDNDDSTHTAIKICHVQPQVAVKIDNMAARIPSVVNGKPTWPHLEGATSPTW